MTTVQDSFQVHLSHRNMNIKLNHLRQLHTTMRTSNNHHLPHRVLYHHLLISARSPLILRDMYLSLIMNNIIHTSIPNDTHDLTTQLHYLLLFLNTSKGSPNLQYLYEGGYYNYRPVYVQRLTLTTNLPSSLISSKRPKQHRMMHTTSYTPGLSETITFPVDSI